ncbi:MAG: restriction endonuclease subunit S [Blastocatellia bacterium]
MSQAQWEKKRLEEVATLQRGKDLPQDQRQPGKVPVIGSNGITGYHSEFAVRGPGVLVGRSGSVGKVTWTDSDYWPLNTSLYVKDFHGNDERFVFYWLSYLDLGKYTAGVSVPTLNRNLVHPLEVTLPPLPEQRAIARALRAVQAAREARRQELQLERERKAALMQHLFTHGTRGEARRQTEIGEIPESWQLVRLGHICNVKYGLGQPPSLDVEGVPMVRATDIKTGRIISDTVIRVKREAIPEKKNAFLKSGDIIVVRSGAYTGDVAMYDGRWETAVAGYDLVVSPSGSGVDSSFVSTYLLGETAQRYFRSQRDRSAQPHLNADQLRNTPILLPPIDEQRAISKLGRVCDFKMAILETESESLDELFRAMLEELMTGRLPAQPLIEAA